MCFPISITAESIENANLSTGSYVVDEHFGPDLESYARLGHVLDLYFTPQLLAGLVLRIEKNEDREIEHVH